MDRGIPDIIGYLTLCGLPVPAHIETAAGLYSYNRLIFLAPYWEANFTPDAERKQSKQEAEATAKVMIKTYAGLGYQLVELPLANIDARADFVTKHVQTN